MSLKVWAYRRLKNTIRKINYYRPRLHREYIYYFPLSKLIDFTSIIEGVELTKISHAQITDLLQIWKVNEADMSARLDRGDHCYVVYINNKPISYHWVQLEGIHFIQPLNQYIEIANDELWFYHVRVAEEYRGQGIGGWVYTRLLKEYKDQGYKMAWIYTSSTNKANQRSLEKVNFEFFAKGTSLAIGKKFFLLKAIMHAR